MDSGNVLEGQETAGAAANDASIQHEEEMLQQQQRLIKEQLKDLVERIIININLAKFYAWMAEYEEASDCSFSSTSESGNDISSPGRQFDINTQDGHGRTAMHFAVAGGCKLVVEAFIERHADLNLVDCKGRTPLDTALKYRHRQIAALLIENGAC